MDNIINTFYKGNINKFGFGGWNTTKNNIKEIIGSYPYPSNWNRQIDRYFQKNNVETEGNSNNLHQNYIPSQIIKSLPPDQRVDFSKSNAMELKPISIDQYKNFDNHGFLNTQVKPIPPTNFSPALIRMEYLENKVRDLENKNRAEMIKSLNEINDKYIDPRFRKFLDNNQIGKYDVFGNDPDPLDQRRLYVQNNLGNMRNKLEVEERRERKKRRKRERKIKKNKKQKKNIFEDSEENGEEENEENDEGDGLLTNENNINNTSHKIGTPIVSPNMTRVSINSQNKQGLPRKSIFSSLSKNQNATNNLNKTISRKNSVNRMTSQKSVKKGEKSVNETKDSKGTKEKKEVKVCGDIGYSFSAKNRREKELQFQTNRLGQDFDKLLNEIREFKKVIKDKIDVQNNDEMNKLNIYKDIFLLDNKAKMKYAVDKILNKTNESFDSVKYQKKVDNEKQAEINDIINKKINDYNDYIDKMLYNKKIIDEKKQMLNNNIINRYEYLKYKDRLNNQIISMPNIYIKPTHFEEQTRQQKTISVKESEKKNDGNNSPKKIQRVIDIVGSEETIHDFDTSIDGDDQFRTKNVREFNERSETVKRFVEEKTSNINSKNINNNLNKNKSISKNIINTLNTNGMEKNNNDIIEENNDDEDEENGKEKLMKEIKEKEENERLKIHENKKK